MRKTEVVVKLFEPNGLPDASVISEIFKIVCLGSEFVELVVELLQLVQQPPLHHLLHSVVAASLQHTLLTPHLDDTNVGFLKPESSTEPCLGVTSLLIQKSTVLLTRPLIDLQ